MNILALSTWFPYPPDNGARIRAWNLLTRLAERHSVRIVAGRQPDVAEADCSLGESFRSEDWKWHSGGVGGRLGDLKALLSPVPRSIAETPNPALKHAIAEEVDRKPDLILVLQMGMDAYLNPLPSDIPAVLEEAEITLWAQASREGGIRAQLTQAKAEKYWRARLKRYRSITTVSEAEAVAVRALIGDALPKISVVPNGVDLRSIKVDRQPEPARLLYNGSLTYGPNRDAVRWFVSEILPQIRLSRPDALLVVTGKVPDDCRDLASKPGVCLTGYLPSLEDELRRATLCVVPLRAGGGTRLKILEAWAAGVPVVSTAVGAAGLSGAVSGEHLVLADEPGDFSDSVRNLLDDPRRAVAIAAEARRLVEAQYDWDAISLTLEGVLSEAKFR